MYPVSAAFHSAIQAGAPQKALLMFADAVFTDTDIAARGGLTFSEPFCSQTDLTIGLCPSATLTASILNPDGILTGFAFGEFTGYLGVKTFEHDYTPVTGANATLCLNSGTTISIHDTAPYVRENGVGVTTQPPFAPQAIVAYETDVYVISAAGAYFKYSYTSTYTWDSVSTSTWNALSTTVWDDYLPTMSGGELVTVNSFMTAKGVAWAAEHTAAVFSGNVLRICTPEGLREEYEMCPLGVFNADKPLTQRKSVVKFTAYDRMEKFDVDVTAWWLAMTYPKTLGQIFASLCTYVGVTPATTTFLNSTHSYTTAPFTSSTITGRAMLKYIAEAACAIARFNRDGKLELDWFGAVSYTSPEAGIVSGAITLAEYEVAAIDKLQVQAETTDIGVVIGTGTNGYILLASPLVAGATDAEIRAFATPIYNRLIAFAAFTPINAKVKSDWSLQSGDIIDIIYEGNTYSLPIYTQSVAWAGDGRSTLVSTGSALRDATTVTNRETFTANQKMTLIEKTVDGVSVTVASKAATFAQASIPTSEAIGDTWIDTDDNNKYYRAASVGANEIKAGEWELYNVASGYVKTSHVEIASNHIDISSGGALNVTAPTTLAITAGSGASAVGIKNDTYFLYAGNATPASAPFSVTMSGELKALSGTFGGAVSGVSGTFTSLTAAYANNGKIRLEQRNIAIGYAQGMFFSTSDDSYMVMDSSGVIQIKNVSSGVQFDSSTPVSIGDYLWVGGNVSALSFTDRTPSYDGDALADLSMVKADKKGDIDHTTLPKLARKKITRQTRDSSGKVETVEEEGRDLGMMISVLTKAVQQLTEITKEQQKRLDALEKRKG